MAHHDALALGGRAHVAVGEQLPQRGEVVGARDVRALDLLLHDERVLRVLLRRAERLERRDALVEAAHRGGDLRLEPALRDGIRGQLAAAPAPLAVAARSASQTSALRSASTCSSGSRSAAMR